MTYIVAFLHWVTLDSTSALCLETILSGKITNKNIKIEKHGTK